MTDWPRDADGDAFRRLHDGGFDFTRTCDIDFSIDLQDWPPDPALIEALKSQYQGVNLFEPEYEYPGYIGFVVNAQLTYELVIAVQRDATALCAPYGGVCESWGVLQAVGDPTKF